VLATDHESVLAFVREYEGGGSSFGDQPETVLCVFSFSHNPVAFRIEDDQMAGTRLYDLFGGAVFPSFDADGALTLTLGAQSFYWLHCG
jgi:maltose alpha-D-glucosyltransferase/alpha-amylase